VTVISFRARTQAARPALATVLKICGDGRSVFMSPIDEEAAERELAKAVECIERADALTAAAMSAADTLLTRASEHVEEAADLRGSAARRGARRDSRRSR
jgi:hypothetical protein